MMRALFAALLLTTFANAALADDLLCAALNDAEFTQAGLLGAGCKLDRQDGAHVRNYTCPGDRVLLAAREVQPRVTYYIIESGEDRTPPLNQGASCPGLTFEGDPRLSLINSIFLSEVATVRRSYRTVATAAKMGTPGYDWYVVVASDGYGSDYKTVLTEIIESVYGYRDDLYMDSSEVRIAGQDITRAKVDDLVAELAKRGSTLKEPRNERSEQTLALTPAVGVPGLTGINVRRVVDRIHWVEYLIPSQEQYLTFARELDVRYGASKPENKNGCTRRWWSNGGVGILGDFCAAKPQSSGFTFFNDSVNAAMVAWREKIEADEKTDKTERPRRPVLDRDMM